MRKTMPAEPQAAKKLRLFLVSDSTGETLYNIASAALAQFDDVRPEYFFFPHTRAKRNVNAIVDEMEGADPVVVLFTLVDVDLKNHLVSKCRLRGIVAHDVLDPVFRIVGSHTGARQARFPGRQHVLDDSYFARMEAMNFAIAHDDGVLPEDIEEADIVLVGVSRTSKTPTSIYLANKGFRVANIPLVMGIEPPSQLDSTVRPLIVGLVTNVEMLLQVRRNRLTSMKEASHLNPYTDPGKIRDELLYARKLFAGRGWPVIDISRRSIEETAFFILELYHARNRAVWSGG